MIKHNKYSYLLFAGSSVAAMLVAFEASAQTKPEDILGEVVVTATRSSSTVNKVAMSVSAVTQKDIDQSGVKNLQDLSRTVPSVTFRRAGGEGNPSVAIRGITSTLGAPTTGIYLDDTPLQKRDNAGSASGNGTPFPQLFDLERVEVLRGPQGTLYGGSAEGGAIRFITPSPSLTRRSVYAKTEVSSTEGGGLSYEGGVATGGPIIQDKLGFRASVMARHTGGWIDEVSIYDGHTFAKDINSGDLKVGRVAFAWQATSNLKVTPAIYYSQDKVKGQDTFWEKVPQFTLNSGTFTNAGTVNGVKFDFPDKFFPGGTFGPYNQYGPGKTATGIYLDTAGNAQEADSPRTTTLTVPTLTLDYDLGKVQVKSITSFPSDRNEGYTGGQFGARTALLPTSTNSGFVGPTGASVVGGTGAAAIVLPGIPTEWSYFNFLNTQSSTIEELRFSSTGEKLSWIGGLFYSSSKQHQFTWQVSNEDAVSIALRGISEAWLLGQTNFTGNNISQRDLHLDTKEQAAFGELNYSFTPKLKGTVGLRYTRSEITFDQATGSSVQGAPPGFVGTATGTVTSLACGVNPISCNSATFHPFPNLATDNQFVTFHGKQVESPVTPKIELSYQATPNALYYLSAAKGFRAGGLNQPVPIGNCGADLAALGLTSTPLTYNSDSVTSYEGGAKLRLFGGAAQLNSSVYLIDWKNPQLQNRLRCGQNYIVNAGAAQAKGFDVQGQTRLGALTLTGSVAYTDAKYTSTYSFPGSAGTTVIIVNKGDGLGAPDWQANLTAQYDFRVMNDLPAYVRGDFQYTGKYQRGVGFGASGYDAATVNGAPTRFASLRTGVNLKEWDLSLFVNNLTNSQDRLYQAHGASSALVTATTFRPREVGMQASYRF